MGRLQSNQNSNPGRSVWADFIQLFFPRACVGCAGGLLRGEEWLCTQCLRDLPITNYHQWQNNPVFERLLGRVSIRSAQAFLHFRKESVAQRLLHELKYQRQAELGVFLGRVYGNLLAAAARETWDVIIPVPLHPTRMRRRGYNQSERFATGLSQELHIPVLAAALVREQATETQTRKDRAQRWENMQQAFCVAEQQAIQNKAVLLVDDVITTGATVEACAERLCEAGCASISIACIAEA